jgi:hypothetical protein
MADLKYSTNSWMSLKTKPGLSTKDPKLADIRYTSVYDLSQEAVQGFFREYGFNLEVNWDSAETTFKADTANGRSLRMTFEVDCSVEEDDDGGHYGSHSGRWYLIIVEPAELELVYPNFLYL